MTSFKV